MKIKTKESSLPGYDRK